MQPKHDERAGGPEVHGMFWMHPEALKLDCWESHRAGHTATSRTSTTAIAMPRCAGTPEVGRPSWRSKSKIDGKNRSSENTVARACAQEDRGGSGLWWTPVIRAVR